MGSPVRRSVGVLAGAIGGAVLLRPGTHANRVLRLGIDRFRRRLEDLDGRLRGLSYRVSGRRPAADVPDQVLADRIRSVLGPVEKRLDIPHIHVMVERHIALLHGDVASAAQAAELQRVVAGVSGVHAVESHLHIGLITGDTRPSAGHHRGASGNGGQAGAEPASGATASGAW